MAIKPWKLAIFEHSPMRIRMILANLEAVQRNRTRHGGLYKEHYHQIDIIRILSEDHSQEKLERLNRLLKAYKINIPHYHTLIPDEELKSLEEISTLPLLKKNDLRIDLKRYINPKPILGFWHGTTGGTAGKVAFARDLASMHYEYALYDRLYEFTSGLSKVKKVRFSNVPITRATSHNPPFWLEVSKMNQLQCSIYHLDQESYSGYLQAIVDYGADIGTGYAFSWHRLAEEALTHDDNRLKLKAVVSDSEGMTQEEKQMVEKAFDCRLYQTYGTSELGIVAVECEQGHYHILDRVHVEVVDDQEEPVADGIDGEIVVTDLWSKDASFLRYCPGDRGILQSSACPCGWESPYLEKLTGRVRDYIVTAEGRKVSMIAAVVKGIPGIRQFQFIQDQPGQLHIRIEARDGFDPEKMKLVHDNAKELIGEMKITWNLVDKIEKEASGKIKTTIRNFD